MYGYEGGTKGWSYHYHKLYARLHAVQCQNTRGVLKSPEQKMLKITICFDFKLMLWSDSFDVDRITG